MPRALAVAALVFAIATAASTRAASYHDASAGSVCHAANGAAAAKFTRSNNYIINNNPTDQYVICQIGMNDASTTPASAYLQVHVQSSNPGTVTMTCVGQTGYYVPNDNVVRSSVARSFPLVGAGSGTFLEWSWGTLARDTINHVVTLNCRMPPGTRLGLIQFWQA